MRRASSRSGFTIVELLIVIVVIAVLAAITVVAYNGITNRAHVATGTSHLKELVKKAEMFRVESGQLPGSILDVKGAKFEDSYVYGGDKYCLSTTVNDEPYHMLSTNQSLQPGYCGNIKPDYPVAAESCFGFDAGIGQIIDYWDYQGGNSNTSNPRCPERFTTPGTIGGVTVTSTGISAFRDQTDIRGVVFAVGLVSLGSGTLYGSALDVVYIPESVTTIGNGAFSNTKLRSIYVPDSITSFGNGALTNMSDLKSVQIGSMEYSGVASITILGSLQYNPVIQYVRLGGIVHTLSGGALSSSPMLRDVRLSEGLAVIENGAFGGSVIETLTLPSTLAYVRGGALASIASLKTLIIEEQGADLTLIQGAFQATSINNLILPGRVKLIDSGAFINIPALTNLTVRPGVGTIGSGAFGGTGITSVSIPNSTTVQSGAFPSGTTITYY